MAAALFELGPAAVADAEDEPVRVAMLMVVFRSMAVPVPALDAAVPMVPGTRTGTVVDAVPLAETVMLDEAAVA